jgi:hypothetical protein
MAKGRPGKAVANERSHPFIIEVLVAAIGLDRAVSREIVAFHTSQRVKPMYGRLFQFGHSAGLSRKVWWNVLQNNWRLVVPTRRLPPPWSVEDVDAAFAVKDGRPR